MGWIKEEPDPKNYTTYHPKVKDLFDKLYATKLPDSVDLRPQCSPVKGQGNLGSCTANAVASAIEFLELKQFKSYIAASRLFIYYNTRHDIEGTSGDLGATITDTIKSTKQFGACPEDSWPYDESKLDTKPIQTCYDAALNYQTLTYVTLSTLNDIQVTLAGGLTIPIGILVFESFENVGSNGIVPMPKAGEKLLGAHAVDVVGYIIINGVLYLIIKNSWSAAWGDKGYFYLPAAYLTKKYSDGSSYANDFKVILTEEYIQNTPIPPIDTCPETLSNAKAIIYSTTITASSKISKLKNLIPK